MSYHHTFASSIISTVLFFRSQHRDRLNKLSDLLNQTTSNSPFSSCETVHIDSNVSQVVHALLIVCINLT